MGQGGITQRAPLETVRAPMPRRRRSFPCDPLGRSYATRVIVLLRPFACAPLAGSRRVSGLATGLAARRVGPEGCPQQAKDSDDCGFFVLMGALHTVHGRPIPYGKPAVWQSLMSSFRRHVAYSVLSAKPKLAELRHFGID